MKPNRMLLSMLILSLSTTLTIAAPDSKQEKPRARAWNEFTQNILKLHTALIANRKVNKKTRTGGYANLPDHYLEESYFDAENGQLLSLVQWVRDQPDQLHSIEVYIRDGQGRVLRDYSATYLPFSHRSPMQTLISLHAYNGDLHAFRSYDASGARIYERCERGEEILLNLDEDQIDQATQGKDKPMQKDPYLTCFKGLEDKAGKYLQPQ